MGDAGGGGRGGRGARWVQPKQPVLYQAHCSGPASGTLQRYRAARQVQSCMCATPIPPPFAFGHAVGSLPRPPHPRPTCITQHHVPSRAKGCSAAQ